MKRETFDHITGYKTGSQMLRQIKWTPTPDEMLKLPSIAKGAKLRVLCDERAKAAGKPVHEIIECVYLAARIEHLIAIGGEEIRKHLLIDDCLLSAEQIARLCRRMPPFIAIKLNDLRTGLINIDTNSTGAFDTNGWSELRTRLPKFRSVLQHYAKDATKKPTFADADVVAIRAVLTTIQGECDTILTAVAKFKPAGAGKGRVAKKPVQKNVSWSLAPVKFAQILGVLQKTNRDLKSKHWKSEWIPTVADLQIVRGDVQTLSASAGHILRSF